MQLTLPKISKPLDTPAEVRDYQIIRTHMGTPVTVGDILWLNGHTPALLIPRRTRTTIARPWPLSYLEVVYHPHYLPLPGLEYNQENRELTLSVEMNLRSNAAFDGIAGVCHGEAIEIIKHDNRTKYSDVFEVHPLTGTLSHYSLLFILKLVAFDMNPMGYYVNVEGAKQLRETLEGLRTDIGTLAGQLNRDYDSLAQALFLQIRDSIFDSTLPILQECKEAILNGRPLPYLPKRDRKLKKTVKPTKTFKWTLPTIS